MLQNSGADNSILACVDGSIYTDSVCAHAGWVSQRLHAPVRVLHVQTPRTNSAPAVDLSGTIGMEEGNALLEKLTQMDEAQGKLDQQKGRVILEHAKEELAKAGVVDIETLHRRGSLVETISELEAASQLIVVGKRGEAADFAKLHLGSNLERVVRAARKPVLVAARSFTPIERFVIAYDGGASTRKAVDYVANNRLLQGMECHLLKVGADTDENRRDIEQAAAKLRLKGTKVVTLLQQGHADDVIAEYVREQSMHLLVMGAYGHSHIRTLIIGSTTANMLRSCPIPVLMFR